MRTMTRRAALLSAIGMGGLVTMRGDELDDLFRDSLSAPVGQAEPVMHRRGRILTFNQNTLQNTVLVDGDIFTDLPIMGLAEVASFKAGAEVGLWCVQNSWAIIGRWVKPNTAAAFEALSFLGGFVNGAVEAGGNNFGDSTSYIDGSSGGPTVSDVRIGPSGMALVIVTGQININVDHGPSWMSYAVSGATTSAATDERGLANGVTSGGGVLVKGRQSAAFLHKAGNTPLTPGLNTFTAKYRVTGGGGAAGDVNASNRNLIVIPL